MASTSLPHFPKNHLLGKLLLLDAKVPLWTSDSDAPLNSPCLYEFALYSEKPALAGVYIGKARRGIGRPIEQYDEFIRRLRQNRLHGLKPGDYTKWPFNGPKQPPWAFRWIHHELERTLYAIACGANRQ